jgi:transketolase
MAQQVRRDVIRMQQRGTGVGSALSAVDLLLVLYFEAMHYPGPDHPDRDRFILSKGHGAAALYAVLARKGVIDAALLPGFLTDGSPLTGHPVRGSLPGIEVSTGSLGHGLPIACGLAHAGRMDGMGYRVFVLLGDGELQEGSVWEGAALAARLGLDNLVMIVDVNGLQGYDRVDAIMPTAHIGDKLRAFGWQVCAIDGHDHAAISAALAACPMTLGRPTAIVARTVKGKGVKEMENQLGWHYFSVPAAKVEQFIAEVEA